jgi:hypothetical protein
LSSFAIVKEEEEEEEEEMDLLRGEMSVMTVVSSLFFDLTAVIQAPFVALISVLKEK